MSSFKKSDLRYSPGIKYDCIGCCLCCSKGWCINLTSENYENFEKINWAEKYPQLKGKELFVPIGSQYRFSMGDDGRCLFLDSDNKCIIHRELGFDLKALTCKFYPLTMTATDDGVRVGAHFSCPAVAGGKGVLLEQKNRKIEYLFEEYADFYLAENVPEKGPLWNKSQIIIWSRLKVIEDRINFILAEDERPLLRRIIEISCLLDYLENYNLEHLGCSEFETVFSQSVQKSFDYADNLGLKKSKINLFARLFCRLFVGLSCEMMIPGLLSRTFSVRLKARIKRIALCLRFFIGKGEFSIEGRKGRFADVTAIKAYPVAAENEKIIAEYMKMRLFCRTYFGNESWGLDVLHGARFLFSLYPIAIYLAKMSAVVDCGVENEDNLDKEISAEHIRRAVVLIDNTFGHLANLSLGVGSRLLSYLCGVKWVEKSALFAVFF